MHQVVLSANGNLLALDVGQQGEQVTQRPDRPPVEEARVAKESDLWVLLSLCLGLDVGRLLRCRLMNHCHESTPRGLFGRASRNAGSLRLMHVHKPVTSS